MKEGKSEVVCEQGQLLKSARISKALSLATCLRSNGRTGLIIGQWISITRAGRKSSARRTQLFRMASCRESLQPTDELVMFEDRWTGSYIFENEWQSFRTRKDRNLELVSASHTYDQPGRYIIAVK